MTELDDDNSDGNDNNGNTDNDNNSHTGNDNNSDDDGDDNNDTTNAYTSLVGIPSVAFNNLNCD